jgi:hypothetical protein
MTVRAYDITSKTIVQITEDEITPKDIGKFFEGIGVDEYGAYWSSYAITQIDSMTGVVVEEKDEWIKKNTILVGYTIKDIELMLNEFGFRIVRDI